MKLLVMLEDIEQAKFQKLKVLGLPDEIQKIFFRKSVF